MADEVIIYESEYANAAKTIMKPPHTTQVVDIATISAKLNARTEVIRIKSKGTGFWYKFGGSAVSAAADTNGNEWLKADDYEDYEVGRNSSLYIDTAADS